MTQRPSRQETAIRPPSTSTPRSAPRQRDRVRAASDAVAALGRGDLVVVVADGSDRAEGNLTLGAEFATAERIHAMATMAGGITVLCLADEECRRLGLVPVSGLSDPWRAAMSIDWPSRHAPGSAHGRAATIAAALDPRTDGARFRRPGHITPTCAQPHGVLERLERTEAAVDLMRAAGRTPAAVATLIVNADGSVASGEQAAAFARRHRLPLVTVTDVAALRWRRERLLEPVAAARLPTAHGMFEATGYYDRVTDEHHLALVRGAVSAPAQPVVRVQRRCFAGDVLGACPSGCTGELVRALARMGAEDAAVFVYLIAGAGVGPPRTPDLTHDGRARPDERLAWIAAAVLRDLGVGEVVELHGGPTAVGGLAAAGIPVAGRQTLDGPPSNLDLLSATCEGSGA